MKKILRISTEIIFFIALVVSIIYVSSDILGLFALGRDVGRVILWLYMVAVPSALILSLASARIWGSSRYSFYIAISGFLMGLTTALAIMFYNAW